MNTNTLVLFLAAWLLIRSFQQEKSLSHQDFIEADLKFVRPCFSALRFVSRSAAKLCIFCLEELSESLSLLRIEMRFQPDSAPAVRASEDPSIDTESAVTIEDPSIDTESAMIIEDLSIDTEPAVSIVTATEKPRPVLKPKVLQLDALQMAFSAKRLISSKPTHSRKNGRKN